jgi:hypothetical protein
VRDLTVSPDGNTLTVVQSIMHTHRVKGKAVESKWWVAVCRRYFFIYQNIRNSGNTLTVVQSIMHTHRVKRQSRREQVVGR